MPFNTWTQNPLNQSQACAHNALANFIQHGGVLRQVWGVLRGIYFQNAFIIGALYIDVANDTVNPNKPPVEILPFEASGLQAVHDYAHFTEIAKSYWQVEIYPNHLFPQLAPYFPLLSLATDGVLRLQVGNDYMIELTRRRQFQPSWQILQQGTVPPVLTQRIQNTLVYTELANSFSRNPEQVLNLCTQFQTKNLHTDKAIRDASVKQYLALNRILTAAKNVP